MSLLPLKMTKNPNAPRYWNLRAIIEAIFSRAFYPVAIAAAMTAHLALARHLPDQKLPLVTAEVAIPALLLFILLERVLPYQKEWNRARGDVLSDLVSTQFVLPLCARLVELLGAGLLVLASTRESSHFWPTALPFALQVALALLIAELGNYWIHRIGHSWIPLWRFHAVHHGASRVYTLNSGRFHPVDAFLTATAYLLPLVLLGVPAPVLAFLTTLNAITGYLEHANIDYRAGVLNRLFNTAQLHRCHHSSNPRHLHCNFGKVLSLWDQVFGTYIRPCDGEIREVGITTDQIPVPVSFLGQFRYPFSNSQNQRSA